MNIERYKIIEPLKRAQWDWDRAPITGDKYIDFDVMAEEVYGLKLRYKVDVELGWRKTFTHAEVIDEKKYVAFLLRWS